MPREQTEVKLKIVGLLEDRSELMKWRICARNFPFTSLKRGRTIQLPWPSPRKQCLGNVSEHNQEIDCSSIAINYRFASLSARSGPSARESR